MELRSERPADLSAVAVIYVAGNVDGSNYQQVIAEGQSLYDAGVRHMVLELSGCSYMSSSGLVAMNALAKLLHGDTLPSMENGWAVLKTLDETHNHAEKPQLVLVNPTPRVDRVLDLAGLKTLLPIYPDVPSALAALK